MLTATFIHLVFFFLQYCRLYSTAPHYKIVTRRERKYLNLYNRCRYCASVLSELEGTEGKKKRMPQHRNIMSVLISLVSFAVWGVSVVRGNVAGVSDLYGDGWNNTVFDCLRKEQNRTLAVVRGTNCELLRLARQSGFTRGEVWLQGFTGGEPDAAGFSIQQYVDYLKENCADVWDGFLWIDAFDEKLWPIPWTVAGYQKNKEYMKGLVDYCVSNKDFACGIKATETSYRAIFNDATFDVAAKAGLPLWSYGYPTEPRPPGFGGWTVPAKLIFEMADYNNPNPGYNCVSPGTYASCHAPKPFCPVVDITN